MGLKKMLAQGIEEGSRLFALSHLDGKEDEQLLNTLMHNFEFVYPYQNLAGLYTKTTVTELKMAAMEDADEGAFHAFEGRETETYIPKFMREEETVSGTTRGSAFHKVMELLDVRSLLEEKQSIKAAILSQLDKMTQSGKLSEEYRSAVSVRKIETFLESNLAKRLAAACGQNLVWREQPFVYGVPASRLERKGETFPEDEMLLITSTGTRSRGIWQAGPFLRRRMWMRRRR